MSFGRDIAERLFRNGRLNEVDFLGDRSGRLGSSGLGFPIGPQSLPIVPQLPTPPITEPREPVLSLPVPQGATPALPLPVIVTETERTERTFAETEVIDVPTIQPLGPLILPVPEGASTAVNTSSGLPLAVQNVPQPRPQSSILPLAIGAAVLIVFLSRR